MRLLDVQRERVVIVVEALVEPVAAIQKQVTHDRCRLVALIAEDLRQGRVGLAEAGDCVVTAVRGRRQGRHQAREGRQRPGRGGLDVFEDDRRGKQRVDLRRGRPLVAVASQVIRPQGIDGDQQQVVARRPATEDRRHHERAPQGRPPCAASGPRCLRLRTKASAPHLSRSPISALRLSRPKPRKITKARR